MTTDKVHFKLLVTPCCSSLLCWVNPRLPNFCPECGKSVYPEIKGCVTQQDENAYIKYSNQIHKEVRPISSFLPPKRED